MPSLNIKDYALVGLGVIIAIMFFSYNGYITILENKVEELQNKVADKEADIVIANINTDACKIAFQKQSNDILKIQVDYNKSIEEFEKFKQLPPKIKYNTIYKTIVKTDYSKGDCNDTKELINSIRNISYNSL